MTNRKPLGPAIYGQGNIIITTPYLPEHTYVVTKGEQEAHEGYIFGKRELVLVKGAGVVMEGPDAMDRYYIRMERGGQKVWIGRRQILAKGYA